MKKLSRFILSTLLVAVLVACGGNTAEQPAAAVSVVASGRGNRPGRGRFRAQW